MSLPRRTLARAVTLRGHGLFSPLVSSLTIVPSDTGGLRARRTDLPDQPTIDADVAHVLARPRHTVLRAHPGTSEPGVHTVEHVLSALGALGVSDALLELNGPEVPALDASALPFARAIADAGVVALPGAGREPIIVRERVVIEQPGVLIEATPIDRPVLALEYELDYGPESPIHPHAAGFVLDWGDPDVRGYIERVAPARTFCTDAEARAMRGAGMFTHLAPADVLVIAHAGPVDTSYRLGDEPAAHKVLDMIGDLVLAGRPIFARVRAVRTGHGHNHALARALLDAAGSD